MEISPPVPESRARAVEPADSEPDPEPESEPPILPGSLQLWERLPLLSGCDPLEFAQNEERFPEDFARSVVGPSRACPS